MRKESYTFEEYNQERESVIKESQYKEKYKNVLIEIKKFVENEMTPNCDTNIIIQKINEVLNA